MRKNTIGQNVQQYKLLIRVYKMLIIYRFYCSQKVFCAKTFNKSD